MSSAGGPRLRRELGVVGATLMGLGSIVGTGVFVSLGLAAGAAGPAVLAAVVAAAFVALCNALSSAQLAASHPVSGGTYEYGYRYLHPALGFTAGWMFLCAKSASAATAALGFAGYLRYVAGWSDGGAAPAGPGTPAPAAGGPAGEAAEGPLAALAGLAATPGALVALAAATAVLVTLLVAGGMRRSKVANGVIVSVTLLALAAFVAGGAPVLLERGTEHLVPFLAPVVSSGGGEGTRGPLHGLLYACALMFVAYTGYGRIATLGEEVREPRRTIPRAIVATLVVTSVLYAAVGLVAVGTVGTGALFEATRGQAAPLEVVARTEGFRIAGVPVHALVALGALTALLGVLLNLLLGLSRVVLAMARRGDLPAGLARLEGTAAVGEATTPRVAVLAVGGAVTALTLLGDVELTWSFSAFTVLVYYALTNLAALRLPAADRLYPRFFPWAGLAACLFLAFWVDPAVWGTGLLLIAAGLAWHRWRRPGASLL